MSNFKDKIQGKAEVVGGIIEKTAGKVLGDTKLQDKGAALEATGKARELGAVVKDAIADAVDTATKKI